MTTITTTKTKKIQQQQQQQKQKQQQVKQQDDCFDCDYDYDDYDYTTERDETARSKSCGVLVPIGGGAAGPPSDDIIDTTTKAVDVNNIVEGGGGGMFLPLSSSSSDNESNDENSNEDSNDNDDDNDDDEQTSIIHKKSKQQTIPINVSRFIMVIIFVLASACFGLTTYIYTTGKEHSEFESAFQGLAEEVIKVSQINANNNFDAMKTLSDLITSYALGSNSSWPFVTHPNWPAVAKDLLKGSSRFVATVPFLQPSLRQEWENYTVTNQNWIQDAIYYMGDNYTGWPIIPHLFEFDPTSLPDGNPFVYETKNPPSLNSSNNNDDNDDDVLSIYLPLWQTTLLTNPPFINFNAWNDIHFARSAKVLIETKSPVMSQPFGAWEYDPTAIVALPEALICQPIYDTFDLQTRQIVGILDANIQLTQFDDILSEEGSDGIIVVLSNPCATPTDFTWEIVGTDGKYLGQGDLHDNQYDKYGIHAKATALQTADTCPYMMHLYPSTDFENQFQTNDPLVYTILVSSTFLLAAGIFLLYDFYVQKRHKSMMAKGIEQAHRAANAEREAALSEREMNEYISHEVRNPLAAAISACSFVSSAINDETHPLMNVINKDDNNNNKNKEESSSSSMMMIQAVRDDVHIINSSLKFINDLLRNILDLHRATNRHLTINKKDTDLFTDVLEPVISMLYCRDDNFELILDCPKDLIIETDGLRLKQVILNLGRNAAKFVEKGFVRLRAETVYNNNNNHNIPEENDDDEDSSNDDENHNHNRRPHQKTKTKNTPTTVRIYVEDSGPGIPAEKRQVLFAKFQQSLDLLSQGTGVGLCLCKQLCDIMGADLWLDEDYKSGISMDCPGTRFVVDLNTLPKQQQQQQQCCCGLLDNEDDDERPSSMTNNDGDEETSSSSTTAEYIIDMKGENNNNNRSEKENINGCNQQEEEKNTVEHLPAAVCENNAVNTSTAASAAADNPRLGNQVEEDNNKRLSLLLPEELSVLFVDDDMVLRKLFSRSIKRLKPLWHVHEASSGETAIRLVDTESYDLIFMDQYMASTEKQLLGTEATRELRAKGVKAKICGLSANHLEKAFLSAGADDFMLKPVPCDKVELEQSLLKLLYGCRKN